MVLLIFFLCVLATSSAQFIDEFQDFNIECQGEGVFECRSGDCILQEQFCDGRYDCKDGSDENFCVNQNPDEKHCNETHQYLCGDGHKCIPNSRVCNSSPDCDDGSDEMNCSVIVISPNATCKGFSCDSNRCISKFWMCDGDYDCTDKTDEDIVTTCRHVLRPHKVNTGRDCYSDAFPFREKEYKCSDKSFCLPKDSMCDGIMDCKDGSDEGEFCQTWHTMCSNFSCNGSNCSPDRSGPYCDCGSPHFKYNYTTKTCESANNCLDDIPWCSHYCHPSGDVFKCTCDEGYITDIASYLCYATGTEAMLLFSTRNDIRYIKLKSKEHRVLASGIKQGHGVSSDGTFIYWVEIAAGHQAIIRAQIENVAETKQVLVALGLEDPGDIAVDWLGGNFYFTDVRRGIIGVCKTDGSICTVLKAQTKKPRFVTLDPRKGEMYWADWQDKAVIMRSRMDGTKPEILVDKMGKFGPTGMALDSPNDRLYFVDGVIKIVKLFDLKVYSLFEEPYHDPYTIVVFENTVFWSDWTSATIHSTDKLHSTVRKNLLMKLQEPVFDMHLYHPVLMPDKVNPCRHSGCSHICVPTSNVTFTCLCPEGMELFGKICKTIPDYHPQYLIVGGGSLFTRIQYDVLGNPETHATHFNIERVQAMAYDNFRGTLYVYDGHRKSINYIDLKDFSLGFTRLFVYNSLENVVDMGYDYVSDALYILDAGRGMIDVISLRTKERTLVYRFPSQEIPISFCILPDYGRLVVAVFDSEVKNGINIDSMGLDGDDRKHIMTNMIYGPNIRLQYSSELDVVYLADEAGVIDHFHPEGTGRERFREFTSTLESFAVTDTHVFWTDRETKRLYWADVHRAGYVIRRMELSLFANNTLLHLQATYAPYSLNNTLLSHVCHQNKTPCSHICVQVSHPLPQDLEMGFKCLCPVGLVQINNTCEEIALCKHNEHYCHRSNKCFASSKKCDGHKDCQFGEDEENCSSSTTTNNPLCRYDQKMCFGKCIGKNDVCEEKKEKVPPICSKTQSMCDDSSMCIESSMLCDGYSDCPDGSDELPSVCDTLICKESEFRCSTGYCVPATWRCDRALDCIDGSDEINCTAFNQTCPEGFHQCSDGSCIELEKRCDGNYDCFDASDEDKCDLPEVAVTDVNRPCRQWEFSCKRNNATICLPHTARCNGKVDCAGGLDEAGCDFFCAPRGKYSCKQELVCVAKSQLCNGINDCTDGSDETADACLKVNKTMPIKKIELPSHDCGKLYKCKSGECLDWKRVCNNKADCKDGTDENGNCTAHCENCPSICRHTPVGPICVCALGFSKVGDTCVDDDECRLDHCSHNCINTPGSFVCTCHPGYELRYDRRSCKSLNGDATLLYIQNNSIWLLISHHHFLEHSYGDKNITDFDFDKGLNKLYVAVPETGEIIEVNKNLTKPSTTAIGNIGRPTEIAVDWTTGNIYFVDEKPSGSLIRVCNFARKACARLHNIPFKVSSLTVDSMNSIMFYCINQGTSSLVQSASLAGKAVKNVTSVNNCTGLAMDGHLKIIYILDNPGKLWKSDFQGHKTLVYNNEGAMNFARSPTLFEDHIYFLNNSQVVRCFLFGHKTCQIFANINASSFTIRRENTHTDVCEKEECSGVCVLDNGPACVCADGSLSDGVCPSLNRDETPLINGERQSEKESKWYYLMYVLLATVVTTSLGLFNYKIFKCSRTRPDSYVRVTFRNQSDPVAEVVSSVVEVPTAGGVNREYVNPLQFVRNAWSTTFHRGTSAVTEAQVMETQLCISDTESDIDMNEHKALLRIR
ncbi:putative vitellogenin receptor isoform X4 [Pieris rapae]|nr:putative vitellogenin receptor isoform X4 [Pieris rapae]